MLERKTSWVAKGFGGRRHRSIAAHRYGGKAIDIRIFNHHWYFSFSDSKRCMVCHCDAAVDLCLSFGFFWIDDPVVRLLGLLSVKRFLFWSDLKASKIPVFLEVSASMFTKSSSSDALGESSQSVWKGRMFLLHNASGIPCHNPMLSLVERVSLKMSPSTFQSSG